MPAAIDLTGKRAGSLLVKEFSRRTRGTRGQSVKLWKCVCNCGAEMELPTGVLSNRKARGCEFCETFTLKTELEGKMFESVSSGDFVVEEYINSTNVHILFINTGTKIITALKEVRKGSVRDIMHPTVCSVGFFGIGEHLGTTEDGCKNSPAYEVWRGIIRRCYDKNCKSYLRYEDVDVCKEWHNFQNFAEWFYSQKHCEDGFAVDKDLKVIGSRLYSPETCSLVRRQCFNFTVELAQISLFLISCFSQFPFMYLGNIQRLILAKMNSFWKISFFKILIRSCK